MSISVLGFVATMGIRTYYTIYLDMLSYENVSNMVFLLSRKLALMDSLHHFNSKICFYIER